MTLCNMSIEAGARAGMVAPDDTTFDYLDGLPHAPSGADWDDAVAYWRTLPSDADATYDAEVVIDAATLSPFVTWGTNPGQGLPLSASVPSPDDARDDVDRVAIERALDFVYFNDFYIICFVAIGVLLYLILTTAAAIFSRLK